MEPVFPFSLDLPARGEGAISRELHRQLRSAILDGRLAAGALMPSTRKVSVALGVARNTVLGAYDLLIAEGYIVPRSGAKSMVANIQKRRVQKASQFATPMLDARINPVWTNPLPDSTPHVPLPPRNFRCGVPEHRFFAHDVWRRLTAQANRESARTGFLYTSSRGVSSLRRAIAQHVAFVRAVACTHKDVVVTSGANQAFDIIARLLVVPGSTHVAVESPGYPAIAAAFIAAGAKVSYVPVDDEGLCVDKIPPNVRIVCVTPSHQSPTGVAMSFKRRLALLQFARTQQAVIVEDDYDSEFRFGNRPLDALQTLDSEGAVFYVGTFSKTIFPALRKGFVIPPEWAREPLVRVKHCIDSYCDSINQSVLAAFIHDGHLARHIRRMQPIYLERREALLHGISHHLGEWLEAIPSEAGLHLSARILQPELINKIAERARRHLPGVQTISEFAHSPHDFPGLIFGYGIIDRAEIETSLKNFASSLRK